ncbi:La domain-containing protein [Loa loa]|uniref:La domain-containing protein n=1 Tax=Loa loa TaxID=7209 RepID=A0A1S0TRM4_LOALO|nr:La domain-containing protein [Loa loa]EFO19002.2 La domain-containing protein [Loa loa]
MDVEKVLADNDSNISIQQKIIEQIEYYFGDINLPRDRFLQEEIKKDDGWVQLTTMLKFKRLAQISSNPKIIRESLKHSELMQVSEDGSKIRRNPAIPLPENSLEYWQVVKRRTVYIKGFERETKLDDILDFVKQFGSVENVMMRREKSEKRAFKGSVFVTYKDQKTAEAFVNSDTKQFNGNDLLKMMQNDYWANKQKELKEKRLAARVAKQAKKNLEMVHFVKGLVLSVENLPKEDCDLTKIKDFFKQFGDVQYVVYEKGDEKAQIRFGGEENGAAVAWKTAVEKGEDGKIMFGGNELKGTVLEGKEEEEYWNNFSKKKADKQARIAKNRRGTKVRGRGRGRNDAGNGVTRGEKRSAEEVAEDTPEKKLRKTVYESEEPKKATKVIFADSD